jgi:putative hydrolase of the HAD superfamily
MMALRALIFDFDGLILDTESAIYAVWRDLYAAHGLPLPIELWASVVGTDFNAAFDPKRTLEQHTGQAFDWEAVEAELTAQVMVKLADVPLLPGVRALLAEAAAMGLPCVVASSSPLHWVQGHLDTHGLRTCFTDVITRERVMRIKPAPDLFLLAAEQLGVLPGEALEDSLNGLNAARAAGIACVVVPGPTTAHLDFSAATRVLAGSLASTSVAELASLLA